MRFLKFIKYNKTINLITTIIKVLSGLKVHNFNYVTFLLEAIVMWNSANYCIGLKPQKEINEIVLKMNLKISGII